MAKTLKILQVRYITELIFPNCSVDGGVTALWNGMMYVYYLVELRQFLRLKFTQQDIKG